MKNVFLLASVLLILTAGLGAQGRIGKATISSGDGQYTEVWTFTWNKKGQLENWNTDYSEGLFSGCKITYDPSTGVETKREYTWRGSPQYSETCHYEYGRLVSADLSGVNGELTGVQVNTWYPSETVYTYNTNGLITTIVKESPRKGKSSNNASLNGNQAKWIRSCWKNS